MAAEDGVYPARWEKRGDCKVMTPDDLADLQMLMEKLQSRSSQYRNWAETIKAVRLAITNDKRSQCEALERSRILSCVDKLQKAIKVENQQNLLEKLESIARQLSLMFNPPPVPDKPACISCDMFNVEILMDIKGIVKDVRVCHQGESMSCEELTEVLSKENYDEFAGHLQGFLSIYKIPGDKKQKSKAYLALQSLETDLNDLAQLQSSIKGVSNCIHKSPLGILLPRKGGYPMKLIYFVSPYDLLDKRSNSPHDMTVEAITEHELGQSVTVCIQQCSVNSRLQTMPLMSVVTQDGKSLPSFQGLSNVNSCMLSACFVLVLPQPIPVALSVVQSISSVTNLDVITVGEQDSLINLLSKEVFKCKVEDEFLVTLPDQQHIFYMNDINGCSLEQPAVMVSKIPFTHPTNVAQVLNCLRQQLLFNTVIGSSIRPTASQECSVVFELNALSLQNMTLSFEHPLHNTMVTAEIDLTDITYPKFKVIYSEEEQAICSEETACKIFQRCLSVPVTLRSVINKVSEEIRKEPTPEPVSVTIPFDRPPPWPPEYYSSHFSPGKIPMDLKNISPNNMSYGRFSLPQTSPQGMYGLMNAPVHQVPQEGILIEPPVPEKPHNPLLADLLDRNSPSPTEQFQQQLPHNEAPIMSKLLQDSTSLASSIPQPPNKPKQVRQRKRSSKSDLSQIGRSPKHPRVSEVESNGSLSHMDFESTGSFDFTDISNQSQPHSVQSQGHPTLTRQLSIIDLTDVESTGVFPPESNMQKLESMVGGNKLQRQPHRQESELSQLLSDYGDTSPSIDRESPHHYYHNSVPKNDKVSTSHEEKILSGSREVLKTTDPSSPNYAHQSLMDLLSIKQEDLDTSFTLQRQNSDLSHSHNSIGESKNCKQSVGTIRSSSMSDLSDSDTLPYKDASRSNDSSAFVKNKNMKMAASVDSLNIKNEIKEEKYESHDLRTLLTVGKEESKNNVIDKDKFKKEDGMKNIRLKLSTVQGLRQSSLPNELLHVHKHKSKTPFDFHSDDDDDDPFDFREKSTMKVISSSPTRLQISNKQKLYNHKLNKEKDKKKESKINSTSGEKRKKDKSESKKEKKKKQKHLENYKSSSLDESAIYKSVAVVSEDSNTCSNQKPIPKLKINKSSLGMSVGKSPSRDILTNKNDIVKKSKDKYDKHLSSSSKKSSQKSKVHQRSSSSNSITVSKADSKLITKTPTIKLKPIAMPTSSSVSIGMAKTPPAYSTASSTKGSSTPTTTTIGRIGAVSLTKSGSVTPPISTKATTPTSLSKSFPGMKSSKSTSALPSAGKISQRSSSSSSNRNSLSESKESKKERNGSTSSGKFPSENRKSNSPMAGSKNSLSSSKSSHAMSKSSSSLSSSTSSPFANKNQSAADVLYFLNTNSSVIANLPKIPKLDKANASLSAGSNKTTSVETNSKTTSTSTPANTKTTSSFNGKTNMTNSTSNTTKNSASTNVMSSAKSSASPNVANSTKSSSPNVMSSTKNSASPNVMSSTKSSASPNVASSTKSSASPNVASSTKGSSPNVMSSTKNSSSPNVTSSKSSIPNSLSHSKQNTTSSPSHSKSVTTPTSVKQNPLTIVSKPNNVIPSSSGGISRSVTTVSYITSNSVKSVTTTSNMTTSKMTTLVSTVSSTSTKCNPSASPSTGKPGTSSTEQTKKPSHSSETSSSSSTGISVTSAQKESQSTPVQNVNHSSSSQSTVNTQHKPRPRKGSLTAVIDKLTKQTSHGPGSEDGKKHSGENKEGDELSDSVSEKEKNIVHCKTDKNGINVQNSKLGMDKINNSSKEVGQIKIRKDEKDGKSTTSSPKNKSSDSLKRHIDSPSKSNSGKENKNDDSRNLFTSILKSASESPYSKDKGAKVSDSKAVVDLSNNVESNSSTSKHNDKNCEVDSSPHEKIANSSVNKHSRTPSPKQNPKKFNGETKDIGAEVKLSKESDKDVFKVPTPKAQNSEEKDFEDTENYVVRKKPRISTSKPILSPTSPVSSPENLVIDCQTLSPRTLQNKTNSPNIDMSSDKMVVSNSVMKSKIPSPFHKRKQSPLHSPVHLNNPGSVSNASPAEIDDDLMNEAVLGFGST